MWTIHFNALKFQGHNLQSPSFLLGPASNNNSPIHIMNIFFYYERFNYVKGYRGLRYNRVCVLTMLQRRSWSKLLILLHFFSSFWSIHKWWWNIWTTKKQRWKRISLAISSQWWTKSAKFCKLKRYLTLMSQSWKVWHMKFLWLKKRWICNLYEMVLKYFVTLHGLCCPFWWQLCLRSISTKKHNLICFRFGHGS